MLWWHFKSLICMWSRTRWTWNRVIKFTWLWYSRVVLLFTSPLHRSASNAILLIIFRSASPHFQNFLSEVGVISLSSQVRNSFSSLKYIEFYCVGKSSCRHYKSLSTIMYVFVREEFSFNRLYLLVLWYFLEWVLCE